MQTARIGVREIKGRAISIVDLWLRRTGKLPLFDLQQHPLERWLEIESYGAFRQDEVKDLRKALVDGGFPETRITYLGSKKAFHRNYFRRGPRRGL